MSRRASGEGALYFDTGSGRWVGQADAGLSPKTGKRRRVKVVGGPGESKTSVAKRLSARIAELEATSPSAPDTVGELVETWRDRAAPKRKSETTLAMTDSLIRNHITPALGSVRLNAITVDHIEAFLDARVSSLSKSTITKLRTILAQAFDFGIRRRHMNWNPARVAEMPVEASAAREGRALTGTEARALLNVASDHRLGAWVVVATTLGLRPGEVSGMTWEAIDLDAGTLTVYQSLGWPGGRPTLKPTKTGRSRTLELPAITVDALTHHRKRTAEERLLMGERWPAKWASLVFVSENGTPLDRSNVRRMVMAMGSEAGIGGTLNPYDLRHTATSLISASGLSAERLADLLGHKDTRMVFGHYRHPVTSSISVAAEYWTNADGSEIKVL
jgi:integrase